MTDLAPAPIDVPAPVEVTPAVVEVLRALRARIELGELLPGEQLRQDVLAAGLGVSRAPIREALRILEHDGIAAHEPNRGYFVARHDADELRQLHRMLELLEGELCARLPWPDVDVLEELRARNAELDAVADLPDPAPAIAANRRFHESLLDRSPDRLLRTELARLWGLAAPTIALGLRDPEARARAVDDHGRILDALSDRKRLVLLRAVEAHRGDEGRHLDASLLPPALTARRG